MTPAGSRTVRHDALTVAAIAVIAALVVIFNHEGLGHGSVCLAVGGRVMLLSSALFRCSVPADVIDVGGPAMSLTLGLIALAVSRIISSRRPGLRLGLMLAAAFAGFWEGGYLVQAMATRQGDLYFAGTAFIGEPSLGWRVAGATLGIALYLATLAVTVRGLASIGAARRVGRIAWFSATTAAILTASVYRGGWGANLLNTFLEIGLASLPLLIIPAWTFAGERTAIARNRWVWMLALLVLIVFAATLGRGIGDLGLA